MLLPQQGCVVAQLACASFQVTPLYAARMCGVVTAVTILRVMQVVVVAFFDLSLRSVAFMICVCRAGARADFMTRAVDGAGVRVVCTGCGFFLCCISRFRCI